MKLALGLVTSAAAAAALPLAIGCGGDDPLAPLFQPEPACEGDPIIPFAGQFQNVISFLEIGDESDGFDLDGASDPDGDGEPDNKLSAVGSFAGTAVEDALSGYQLMIPVELFDLPAVGGADACVKLALYHGIYRHDGDGDGRDTAVSDADCDDTRATSGAGMPELAGNFVDDDCDGMADETDATPSTDTADHDGDGVTLAAGDCDDSVETGARVGPGLAEVCGDRLDNDCDHHADSGASCDPYTTVQTVDIDPLSFDDGGAPLIVFDNGAISADGVLTAGPAPFAVQVPVTDGLTLDLRITGAQIIADVATDGDSVRLTHGRLGGVIDSRSADDIRGLTYDQIGLVPEDSLLDAVYANVLGTLLSLRTGTTHGHPGCKQPDIDVDRDGYEVFCDTTPDDSVKTVDLCIDGDGTEIFDEVDGDGHVITECSAALRPDGTPRFVDGISVELNFETAPTILRAP